MLEEILIQENGHILLMSSLQCHYISKGRLLSEKVNMTPLWIVKEYVFLQHILRKDNQNVMCILQSSPEKTEKSTSAKKILYLLHTKFKQLHTYWTSQTVIMKCLLMGELDSHLQECFGYVQVFLKQFRNLKSLPNHFNFHFSLLHVVSSWISSPQMSQKNHVMNVPLIIL